MGRRYTGLTLAEKIGKALTETADTNSFNSTKPIKFPQYANSAYTLLAQERAIKEWEETLRNYPWLIYGFGQKRKS